MIRRSLFRRPVHHRLAPLLAASFFGGIALWVPVEKLFLAELGFTPRTIGLMAAAYAAVVPILEMPSGFLADRWSRRGVLLVGNVSVFASVLIGGLSTNVETYLVAALLLGVYFAMQSGTFESIVYDTVLEETGDSELFESLLGRVRMVESASLVAGALAGGALAVATSPRITYFLTLPFLVVSTLCLLSFREPRLHERGESRSLRRHVAVTVEVARRTPGLGRIASLLVLTSVVTQAVFEFGPLWLVEADAGAGAFGPAWAGLMASLGFGGAVAGRLRSDRAGTRRVLAAMMVGSAAVLVTTSHVLVVTVAQVLAAMMSVVLTIFLTRELHDAVPSDVRAGVASAVGMATWATFLPFALLFGAVSEQSGVRTAGWLLVATAAAVAVVLVTKRPAPIPEAVAASTVLPVLEPCPAAAAAA